jgi:predicted RNA-binding Zn-ribbon protein involved in translation (DUF1610 family)
VGYGKSGRRPAEYASKSAHGYLILDREVQSFLKRCELPKSATEIADADLSFAPVQLADKTPIRHVIAIDGGYQEAAVRDDFPTASVCFLQFGALMFAVSDLEDIDASAFIDPKDMARLKDIERRKLVVPVRNVTLKGEATLTASVRRAIHDFFNNEHPDSLNRSLCWFIFSEYSIPKPDYGLASCPNCQQRDIVLKRSSMKSDYTFDCPACGGCLYLTDVLRLHEAVDDELGAGGALAYLTTSVEQLILNSSTGQRH